MVMVTMIKNNAHSIKEGGLDAKRSSMIFVCRGNEYPKITMISATIC